VTRFVILLTAAICLLSVWATCWHGASDLAAQPSQQLDPAAWGGDHVGKPVPEYITGDECLFCHRNDVGPSWQRNRHNLTLRIAGPEEPALAALKKTLALAGVAGVVKLLLGGGRRVRFLKPTERYGELALLSAEWVPPRGGKSAELLHAEKPQWNERTFGQACAGCHSTGVDPETKAFAATSLDCYVCHGHATLEHTKNTSLIHLAKKREDPARVVTSICAQCHVRTGKSRSTGLPYPNNFVAGDNLFRDFQVDFSAEAVARLNPADRHVLENVRDVVLHGKGEVTCLSCHDVHKQSAKKHHRVTNQAYCQNCHNPTGPKSVRPPYEVHSPTCGY
jgi:hypothetical protein